MSVKEHPLGTPGVPSPICLFLPLRRVSLGTLPCWGRRRPGPRQGPVAPLGMLPSLCGLEGGLPSLSGPQNPSHPRDSVGPGWKGCGAPRRRVLSCALQAGGSPGHTLSEPRGRPRARVPLSGVLSQSAGQASKQERGFCSSREKQTTREV